MTKTAYDTLSDKQKQDYLNAFRYSRHKTKHRAGRKRGNTDGSMSSPVSKKKRATISEQVKVMRDAGAGVINKESVEALSKLEPHHLAAGALKISENRRDIRDSIIATLKDKPDVAKEGFEGLRELMRGEGHGNPEAQELDEDDFDDDDVDDDLAAFEEHRKSGDGKIDKDDLTVEDLDEDDDFVDDEEEAEESDDEEPEEVAPKSKDKGSKSDSTSKKKKKNKEKRGHKDKRKEGASRTILHHAVKLALLGAGVALLAAGAGPLGMIVGRGLMDMWDTMGPMQALSSSYEPSDEDVGTIDEIITQTVDYLRSMDLNDLESSTKVMFKAIAAINPSMESSVDRSHSLKIWTAKRNGLVFKPFAQDGEFGEELGPVSLREEEDEEELEDEVSNTPAPTSPEIVEVAIASRFSPRPSEARPRKISRD